MENDIKDFIKYIKSLGIEVHLTTKARGNQGFYLKNRIDINRNISKERIFPILLHEFTHYIHSKIEPFMERTGGSIEVLFDDDNPKFYETELLEVTKFVDKNSRCEKLLYHKNYIKEKINAYETIIKNKYPNFQRSKKFAEFNRYIKCSDAKYLLKHDRIKLIRHGFNREMRIYSIDNLENDFTDMPKEFAAFIRLKSCQKKQTKISSKINKISKYYSKPAELFARFVEGLYIDTEQTKKLAPNSYKRFCELVNTGYYKELFYVVNSYIFNIE